MVLLGMLNTPLPQLPRFETQMTDVTCLPPAPLYPTQLPVTYQYPVLSNGFLCLLSQPILLLEGCFFVEKLMVDVGRNKNGGGDGGDGGGSGWRTL